MQKSIDKVLGNLDQDQIVAAATAATTANAVASAIVQTNIEFIKKDITEIKESLLTMANKQESKTDALARLVYTGLGIAITLPFLLKFLVK